MVDAARPAFDQNDRGRCSRASGPAQDSLWPSHGVRVADDVTSGTRPPLDGVENLGEQRGDFSVSSSDSNWKCSVKWRGASGSTASAAPKHLLHVRFAHRPDGAGAADRCGHAPSMPRGGQVRGAELVGDAGPSGRAAFRVRQQHDHRRAAAAAPVAAARRVRTARHTTQRERQGSAERSWRSCCGRPAYRLTALDADRDRRPADADNRGRRFEADRVGSKPRHAAGDVRRHTANELQNHPEDRRRQARTRSARGALRCSARARAGCRPSA